MISRFPLIFSLIILAGSFQARAAEDFSFALRGEREVFLQGKATAGGRLPAVCGSSVGGCECSLLDAAGITLAVVSGDKVAFEPTGFYYTCRFPAPINPAVRVRLKQARSARELASLTLISESELTFENLMGDDLNLNFVRSIFSYQCRDTFLMKHGTTPEKGFNCSNPPVKCGPAEAAGAGNFCTVIESSKYYLYQDAERSNFDSKPTESFYNAGRLCGLMVPEYQCNLAMGAPREEFGLFRENVGQWKVPVRLSSNFANQGILNGFGVAVNADGKCPPGLEAREVFSSSVSNEDMARFSSVGTNFPGSVSSVVAASGQRPDGRRFQRIYGGNCDGRSCTRPKNMDVSFLGEMDYQPVPGSKFCAIPARLLP